MSATLLVAIAAFVGVAALVGGVALLVRDHPNSRVEGRLEMLTGVSNPAARESALKQNSVLSQPLDTMPGAIEELLNRFGNVQAFLDQADTNLTVPKLSLISGGLAVVGAGMALAMRLHPAMVPTVALTLGVLPVVWIWWRRRGRLKHFAAQLPEALDMLARALRAGQSLSAGFNMVATELGAPLGKEFQRVFEEQNLGVPLEEALDSMAGRIPNLDLKFFVTAVILQRQTGGDLAEILDKIGRLIRERFQIWGQIQALTGEGRLSGIILLALPVVLFVVVYRLNPDYVSVLFTDEMGKQMLVGAVVMQLLGALVIKKIINIKV